MSTSPSSTTTEPAPKVPRELPRELKPRVERTIQLAKMASYFVLIGVGARILQEIFQEISKTEYVAELSRVSGLAASILDVNKNIDDLIITFFALTITFLLILPVAWVHTLSKGDNPDPSLTQTLIMVSIIVAGVMLLLEDNLARSFSLVGVVAAVRYRHNLNDPKDAVYVFLSLGIGMACGLQAYHVALLLSVFECVILLALWMFHTGAPAMDEAKVFQALKAREKKGERSPAEALAWLPSDARARLEAELEQQSRYIAMASMAPGKNGKRMNCVITIDTDGSSAAQDAVNAHLEDHRGKWRLLSSTDKGDTTTLEYMGRLGKKRSPPVDFVDRLQKAHPGVKHVAFRSLRKMVPETLEADRDEANGAQEPTPERSTH